MKAELAYRLLVTLLFASEQQWGTASGSRTTASATFPLKFETIYAIAESNNANYDENVGVTDVTVSGFKYRCYYGATIRYIAIGK